MIKINENILYGEHYRVAKIKIKFFYHKYLSIHAKFQAMLRDFLVVYGLYRQLRNHVMETKIIAQDYLLSFQVKL